jgi:hypothetical protein
MERLNRIFRFSGFGYLEKGDSHFDTILYHTCQRSLFPKTNVRTYAFETRPNANITIDFSGHKVDFPSSGGIFYSSYKELTKPAFAMIIRDNIFGEKQYLEQKICFGLHGYYDQEQNIHINKIFVPQYPEAHELNLGIRIRNIPVTNENIELSLMFAEKCAAQILKSEPLTSHRNFIETSHHYLKYIKNENTLDPETDKFGPSAL